MTTINDTNPGLETQKAARRLLNELSPQTQTGRARLAQLRSIRDITDPRAANLWPWLLNTLPTLRQGWNSEATPQAKAVYEVLHLYAIYQQGTDHIVKIKADKDQPVEFFDRYRQVKLNLEAQQKPTTGLDRQFQRLVKSVNWRGIVSGFNRLISIMNENTNFPVDFARLAKDLYWVQSSLRAQQKTIFTWGEQYYKSVPKAEKDNA